MEETRMPSERGAADERRFPLKWKFGVLLAGFVLAITTVIFINFRITSNVTGELVDLEQEQFPHYTHSSALVAEFDQISRMLLDAGVFGEPELLDRSLEKRERFLQHLAELEATSSDSSDKSRFESIRTRFIRYFDAAHKLAKSLIDSEGSEDLGQLRETQSNVDVGALKDDLVKDLQENEREQRAQMRTAVATIKSTARKQSLNAVGIGALACLVLVFFLVQLTQRVVRPIAALSRLTGEVAKGNLNAQLDIRKLGRDEVADLTKAFREMTNGLKETTVSKGYVDRIIESMAETLVVVSPDGKITFSNGASMDLLGYEPRELVGRNSTVMFPDANTMLSASTAGGGILTDVETVYISKDGREIPVSVSASAMISDSGELQAFVCLAQDMTERKKAREELQRANDDLAEARDVALAANQTKSQFLANMSHELRTPLNAIIGYSEMLQEEAEDMGEATFVDDLKKIQAAGRHLLGLINDILDISKIEAGKMQIFLEDFQIVPTIADVVTTVRPLVEKNANELELRCPEDIGVMHADVTRVRQVLFNLLSNACKFTKEGRITLEAIREKAADGEWMVFKVSDTGIGMSPDQVAKLFKPFTQADASTTRKYGGTGLGLTISKYFCNMMHGDLTLESEYGKGTTFTARIPAVVEEKQPEAATSETAAPPKESAGEKQTVLVIDDDPDARDLLGRFLVKEGFHVESAANGPDGIRMAKELLPVAITLDVMMPNMDGWQVLNALKGDPELAAIPVFMVTMVENRSLGYALGVSEYLRKPIDYSRLSDLLKKYVSETENPQVLVVEDDESVRGVMRKALEKQGCRVLEAENGRIALDRLKVERPTLILLDIAMPVMNGFEFLHEFKQVHEWAGIPIVVLTSKDLTAEEIEQLEGQVKAVVQKRGTSPEELFAQVGVLIRGSLRKKTYRGNIPLPTLPPLPS